MLADRGYQRESSISSQHSVMPWPLPKPGFWKNPASLARSIDHIEDHPLRQDMARSSIILEATKLPDVIETTKMNAGSFARHGIEDAREFDAVLVMIDRHRYCRSLSIISNTGHAIKDAARESSKSITVRVKRPREELVVVEIQDNGVGIPKENLEKIFNYGFTTRKKGHGFGLHSSANMIKELGGAIRVRSDGEGQGAIFYVEIPIKMPGAR